MSSQLCTGVGAVHDLVRHGVHVHHALVPVDEPGVVHLDDLWARECHMGQVRGQAQSPQAAPEVLV